MSEFKRRLGIPIVRIPAHFWAVFPAAHLLRIARPGAHYRATGRLPHGMKREPGSDQPATGLR